MNRKDFQSLSRSRLKEARVLLRNECFEGAYYLAGYVIEFALKACIAKKTRRYDFPDRQTAHESHTHDLKALVKAAGLQADLDNALANDPAFKAHWQVAVGWKETSRYQRPSAVMAAALIKAVADAKHGVLRWLRQYW
jgi:HEPN domain-containing protein